MYHIRICRYQLKYSVWYYSVQCSRREMWVVNNNSFYWGKDSVIIKIYYTKNMCGPAYTHRETLCFERVMPIENVL